MNQATTILTCSGVLLTRQLDACLNLADRDSGKKQACGKDSFDQMHWVFTLLL